MSAQLRAELKHFDVGVALVDPGLVNSRMTQTATEQTDYEQSKLPPQAQELYGDMLAGQRAMSEGISGAGKAPEDVAKVYYLALTEEALRDNYSADSLANELL